MDYQKVKPMKINAVVISFDYSMTHLKVKIQDEKTEEIKTCFVMDELVNKISTDSSYAEDYKPMEIVESGGFNWIVRLD